MRSQHRCDRGRAARAKQEKQDVHPSGAAQERGRAVNATACAPVPVVFERERGHELLQRRGFRGVQVRAVQLHGTLCVFLGVAAVCSSSAPLTISVCSRSQYDSSKTSRTQRSSTGSAVKRSAATATSTRSEAPGASVCTSVTKRITFFASELSALPSDLA